MGSASEGTRARARGRRRGRRREGSSAGGDVARRPRPSHPAEGSKDPTPSPPPPSARRRGSFTSFRTGRSTNEGGRLSRRVTSLRPCFLTRFEGARRTAGPGGGGGFVSRTFGDGSAPRRPCPREADAKFRDEWASLLPVLLCRRFWAGKTCPRKAH